MDLSRDVFGLVREYIEPRIPPADAPRWSPTSLCLTYHTTRLGHSHGVRIRIRVYDMNTVYMYIDGNVARILDHSRFTVFTPHYHTATMRILTFATSVLWEEGYIETQIAKPIAVRILNHSTQSYRTIPPTESTVWVAEALERMLSTTMMNAPL